MMEASTSQFDLSGLEPLELGNFNQDEWGLLQRAADTMLGEGATIESRTAAARSMPKGERGDALAAMVIYCIYEAVSRALAGDDS